MDRNAHVTEYLSYYADFKKSPGFAVLLNGPWGIGKTFLVKEFIKSFEEKGLRHVYVSLYGLGTLAEVDDALLRALYPLLDTRAAQWGGRAAKVAAKFFRVDPEVKPEDFFDKAKADIYIFDDLERCNIAMNTVLGYINEFVEHEQRKVLIIANEAEIKNSEEYVRIREKLIGKTFEIQSAFETAHASFLDAITHAGAKAFLKSKAEAIAEVFHQSDLNNLRVLQQALWDFERFYAALDAKHTANDAAMTELLQLLFAISFEIKAGRLGANDLHRRQSALVAALMGSNRDSSSKPPPFSQAQSRYPEIMLGTSLLSDETIIDLLIKGIIDRERIANELNASSYFLTVEDEPAWRTVWHLHERTEDEFNRARADLEKEFTAREFSKTGEILHVFGIRLWLGRIGELDFTPSQVVDQCKAYVDDLYTAQRLEIGGNTDLGIRFSGYGGLAFQENETSEYCELQEYFEAKRRLAEIDKRPHIATQILDAMKSNPDNFYRSINLTADGASKFYNVPILAAIRTTDFVEAWLSLHPRDQRTVAVALKGRYDHGQLHRDLQDEKAWAADVRNLILARTKEMSAATSYRIRANLAYALDPVLDGPAAPAVSNEGESEYPIL